MHLPVSRVTCWTWDVTSVAPTVSSPTWKPLSVVPSALVQYTIVPGASAGATPIVPPDPSDSPVSCVPLRLPPRMDTAIGTSLESRRSASQSVFGIVHDVADV